MATKGVVKGIVSNLVTVEVDGPVSQMKFATSMSMAPS